MKILKRIAAGVLAAAITAGSLTVGASAASKKMKLYTASIDMIEDADSLWSLGDGYYSVDNCTDPNLDPDIDQIVYIGKDELADWRKTGKISYKKVKTDVNMTDLAYSGRFTGGNFMQFITYDQDGNPVKRYVVSHDEKNTKITTAYTKGSDWSYTNPNGYTVEAKWNEKKQTYTVTVTAPDGTKKSNKLTYKGEGDAWGNTGVTGGTGKYVAYVMWKTNEYTDSYYTNEAELPLNQSNSFVLYGVKKNGKFDTLLNYEGDESLRRRGAYNIIADRCGSNFIIFHLMSPPVLNQRMVYLSDSRKIVSFEGVRGKEGGLSSFTGISSDKIYGSRAIFYRRTDENTTYFLADLPTEPVSDAAALSVDIPQMATALSDIYQHMSTEDGKIYLVQNEEGKWGYLNKKGKEIAMFDDAGPFIGDYAPVVKNGKAYLVDRNMKQVSEKIDADGVTTLGEGLFRVTKGDKVMLMTYKK